ncbi:MAG TPA: phenylalanine--tRNA ligase subunit alpha [Gemmatimonadaceae bacterium]|nr:phenylalanine--tRNA ligase subunit alpha [Gemmatimonadaceae bacterium]
MPDDSSAAMSATLDDYLAAADTLEQEGLGAIRGASSIEELESVRNELLGRKSGRLTELMRRLPTLDQAVRRDAGAAANRVKERLEQALEGRRGELDRVGAAPALLDPSMPARHQWTGAKHAVTQIIEEIAGIFRELGFTIAIGPEAETEWYNFHALNFPPDHPAMDMHDTLYLEGGVLLRTHTSPVQIRTLQAYPPPVRVLIPGNCYRRDFFDPSHAPGFVQIEGLAVDEGISFVDFKATLSHFANRIYGKTRTRFRPSYFPFTEPSAEMDVECRICRGSGCSSCKQTGWIEILGSGMVHPAVLEACGVDSERYTGWAFGMGPARIAIARYGIPDIRLFYDSDIRFLERFA